MSALQGKTVILGITGGIAAYKSCEVVSRLVKAGASVHVVMTKNALEFVQPLTLTTLSGNPVVHDTFQLPDKWEVEHIALAKRADLIVIAPATANIIAKLAVGIADDMLTTVVLASKAPVLLAPAMNTVMWEAEVTQGNLRTLLGRGWRTVGPEGGVLACGDIGAGRMSEPVDVVVACEEALAARDDLRSLSVLVTAGPTREALDPVRFLSNRSSGRMGYAIAQAALSRGANVTLVTGPVSIRQPGGARVVHVVTTDDLYREVTSLASSHDIIIQAAAPADYRPKAAAAEKIKKQPGQSLVIELVQTQDVAKAVGEQKKPGQTLVGFAAETGPLVGNARQKLQDKSLDLIVFNDVAKVGSGFDVDTNELTFITADGAEALPLMTKREAADRLLDRVLRLRNEKAG